MRLGYCGEINDAAMVAEAGYDFLEVNIQKVLAGESDDATWAKTAPDPAKLAVPIEAANCLLPGHLKVIGPERDLAALGRYMSRVAQRAARLGIHRLVFGSGGARRRPETVSEAQADEDLRQFAQLAADACGEHDVLLVIEHLNRGETNTLNTLHEARLLAEHVEHPALAVLVDSYHFGLEKETEAELLALGERVRHVHVAEPVGRIEPGGHGADTGKAFDFIEFFSTLRKLGYDERISIEASWSRPFAQTGADVRRYLQQAWNEAGAGADARTE